MKNPTLVLGAFALLVFATTPALADNKKVVQDFYQTAFVKHQPAEAMKNFVGDRYIQHNPHVKNGPQPFIDYFTEFYKKNPKATTEIKRMVAENDLVVVHAHSIANPKDRGYAAIDIFRLENGKIVEHWDTVQSVPAKSANENGMF
jgi:predicted SnoaL-like aldol condensation-catalyzing enzyme